MANGNKKITSPLEFKDGKLIVGQGIDAFQIAVDKEGGLLVEDPTTRIAGNYPDMYPWKAPEGYPEAAISFAKDSSYPPDNIPVSCLAGAIRALKQLVLHTSTGVDTPPPDDPDTSLALGVEDGDLVVIASDGMWHKATPPTLEPSPEHTPPPTEGGDVQVMRLVRQYEPEAFALASMMLFTGVYIEKLGQVVTSNYVSHPDWHFPSGAVLYLDPNNPGKMTEEDTGYPVGICQIPSYYGTTIYLEPLMWGIDKGINDSRRASYEVATGLTTALASQKTELTEQMKAAHALIDEHIQALNTSVESLQQFQTTQEALNATFATQTDIENVRGEQKALGTRIDNLVTEQEELKTETERLDAEDTALHQSISDHETAVDTRFTELDASLDERFAGVTQTTDALKTQIEDSVQALNDRLDNGDIDFWFPPEPLPFTPIDLKSCLIPGDMREQILVDMAVRIQPSGTTGIYVETVTYDEVTQFSTIILTGEYQTGDNQLQYGLAKEFMPNMDCSGEITLPAVIPVSKLPMATSYSAGVVTTAERIESGGIGVVTSDLAHTESQRLEQLIEEAGASEPPAASTTSAGVVRLASDVSVDDMGVVTGNQVFSAISSSIIGNAVRIKGFSQKRFYWAPPSTAATSTLSVSLTGLPVNTLCFLGFDKGLSYSPAQPSQGGWTPETWINYIYTACVLAATENSPYSLLQWQVSQSSTDALVSFRTGSSLVNGVYQNASSKYTQIGYPITPIVFKAAAVTLPITVNWLVDAPNRTTVVAPGTSSTGAIFYGGSIWILLMEYV